MSGLQIAPPLQACESHKVTESTKQSLFLTWGVLVTAVVVAVLNTLAWPMAPADPSRSEFSSERALIHLQAISAEARGVGSKAHRTSQQYLYDFLHSKGLSPEIQRALVINTSVVTGPIVFVDVENVLVRIPGKASGKAILFVAHYDSVPLSRGAADNGYAVASMLEVIDHVRMRADPLQRDMIFLFTDGEELGSAGARAFVEQHPRASEIGMVFNFDSRGNKGPVVMFETSGPNAGLIREFGRAAVWPVATSLANDIYRRMPNSTDFTVFRKRGVRGLNFANIEGIEHYHTCLDTFDAAKVDTLRHLGNLMLNLALHCGNSASDEMETHDAVYFTIGSLLFYYSTLWIVPAAVVVTLVLGTIVLSARKRGLITFPGTANQLVRTIVILVLSGSISCVMYGFFVRNNRDWWWLGAFAYNSSVFVCAIVAILIAVVVAVAGIDRKERDSAEILFSDLLFWNVLVLVTAYWLPGASYLFLMPVTFAITAGVCVTLGKSRWGRMAFALAASAVIVLHSSVLYHIYHATGFRFIGVIGAWMSLVVLVALRPLLNSLARLRWWISLFFSLAGISLTFVAVSRTHFDERHPKPNQLSYAVDCDSSRAFWFSADQALDGWTGQFFPSQERRNLTAELPWLPISAFVSSAPVISTTPPRISAANIVSNGVSRTIHLRVVSQRNAPVLFLRVQTQGDIISYRLEELHDKPLSPAHTKTMDFCKFGDSVDGISLELAVTDGASLKVIAADCSYALPNLPGLGFQARPRDTMPRLAGRASETTFAKSQFIVE